jgi:Tfp pilus assembly protein PilN
MSTATATKALRRAKFNLAPEVYQASLRNKKRKKLVTTIGIAVSVVSAGLVIVLLLIIGGQAIALKTLNDSIKAGQAKVQSYPDLQDAVTAQQHLSTLNSLYGQRIYMSKFFNVLQTFSPQGVSISSASLSTDNNLTITGSAKSFDLVTKFAKALEGSNTQVGPNAAPSQQPFFSGLNLSTVSNNNGLITFSITTQVSPEVTSGN